MQRLSLGSPVPKLHGHGGVAVSVAREDAPTAEDAKRRDSFSSSSSLLPDHDDGDRKAAKLSRLSTSSLSHCKPEKFVHLIPLLTILCFLILYLCSHSPSQTDLAQFNGFKRSPKRIEDSTETTDHSSRLSHIQKSSALAIQSLRNLQEIKKRSSKSQLSRKHGDF